MRHLPGVRQRSRAMYYRKRGESYNAMAADIPTDSKMIVFQCFQRTSIRVFPARHL